VGATSALESKLDAFEGTVEDIQTRATIIKTYDGRRVVIPNAELFTHSVTVNTAFEMRRWEYELSTKVPDGLAALKSFLADTVAKVDGVLSTPVPEALVIDLGDPDTGMVKLRLTWWTKSPRQHENGCFTRSCVDRSPASLAAVGVQTIARRQASRCLNLLLCPARNRSNFAVSRGPPLRRLIRTGPGIENKDVLGIVLNSSQLWHGRSGILAARQILPLACS